MQLVPNWPLKMTLSKIVDGFSCHPQWTKALGITARVNFDPDPHEIDRRSQLTPQPQLGLTHGEICGVQVHGVHGTVTGTI